MKNLLIVGAGGHGRSLAEAVLLGETFHIAGFVDDSAPQLERVWDLPVLGKTAALGKYRAMADAAIVGIGNNAVRERLLNQLAELEFELPVIVHPGALVSPRAVIGPGSAVMAGAVVGTEAQLGTGVIVNCGAVVDHHCRVEDFGHLGTHAAMAGGSILGRAAWMQAGSALGYGVKLDGGVVLKPGVAISAS